MMIGKGNLPLSLRHPSNVKGALVVKGQAEVSAIRFSPTSLPDPPVTFHWRVRHYVKFKLILQFLSTLLFHEAVFPEGCRV